MDTSSSIEGGPRRVDQSLIAESLSETDEESILTGSLPASTPLGEQGALEGVGTIWKSIFEGIATPLGYLPGGIITIPFAVIASLGFLAYAGGRNLNEKISKDVKEEGYGGDSPVLDYVKDAVCNTCSTLKNIFTQRIPEGLDTAKFLVEANIRGIHDPIKTINSIINAKSFKVGDKTVKLWDTSIKAYQRSMWSKDDQKEFENLMKIYASNGVTEYSAEKMSTKDLNFINSLAVKMHDRAEAYGLLYSIGEKQGGPKPEEKFPKKYQAEIRGFFDKAYPEDGKVGRPLSADEAKRVIELVGKLNERDKYLGYLESAERYWTIPPSSTDYKAMADKQAEARGPNGFFDEYQAKSTKDLNDYRIFCKIGWSNQQYFGGVPQADVENLPLVDDVDVHGAPGALFEVQDTSNAPRPRSIPPTSPEIEEYIMLYNFVKDKDLTGNKKIHDLGKEVVEKFIGGKYLNYTERTELKKIVRGMMKESPLERVDPSLLFENQDDRKEVEDDEDSFGASQWEELGPGNQDFDENNSAKGLAAANDRREVENVVDLSAAQILNPDEGDNAAGLAAGNQGV